MDRKSEPAILTMFYKLSMFNCSIFVSIDNLFLYRSIFQLVNGNLNKTFRYSIHTIATHRAMKLM